MIAVSKCLAGCPCRYDGKTRRDDSVCAMVERGQAFCICPELEGGLGVPRVPCEIVGGDGADVLMGRARVINREGRDCTEAFVRGAARTLEALRERGIRRALLKGRSPSCGCGEIYDGSFSGTRRAGNGVTAALLLQNGIAVEER